MQLTHRFTLSAPVEQAWAAFSRLDRLAQCFPGATVTGAEGSEYAGFVKIKFGPVPLVYDGTARMTRRDEKAHRLTVEARGKDRRGHGTATAVVTANLAGNGRGTDVEVRTDLVVTGRPAQLGHGVIQGVSDRLLHQFTDCLSSRMAETPGAGADGGGEGAEPDRDAPAAADRDTDLRDSDFATEPRPGFGYTPPPTMSAPQAQVLPAFLRQNWPVVAGAAAVALVLIGVVWRRLSSRG